MRTTNAFSRPLSWLVAIVLFQCLAASAWAHPGHGAEGGFQSGLSHPWSGLDHILAMVAVGLWSAQLGGRARWLLPVVFPLVMACGGLLGLFGVQVAGIEVGIACSVLLLGALVFREARPRVSSAILLVAVFALFHGYAHGRELPPGQSGMLYSLGFVTATVSLHCLGIVLGLLQQLPKSQLALRAAGATISLMGVVFLLEVLL